MTAALASTHTNSRPDSIYPVEVNTRFTRSVDSTGWLRIRMEPAGTSAFLCEFVKVSILKEDDRTHFMIMQGSLRGKIASLNKNNADKCLINGACGKGAELHAKIGGRKWWVSKPRRNEGRNQLSAKLTFNKLSAMITLDSDVDYTETNPMSPHYKTIQHSKPLPPGIYKILTPEVPKSANMTEFYATAPGGYPDLKYHTV